MRPVSSPGNASWWTAAFWRRELISSGRRLFLALRRPIPFIHLPSAPQGQRVRRDRLGNHAARADIAACADFRIPQVRQMLALRPGAQIRVLELDEIADVTSRARMRARAQT